MIGVMGLLEDCLDDEAEEARRVEDSKAHEEEEARKKTWLLNEETQGSSRTIQCGGLRPVSSSYLVCSCCLRVEWEADDMQVLAKLS